MKVLVVSGLTPASHYARYFGKAAAAGAPDGWNFDYACAVDEDPAPVDGRIAKVWHKDARFVDDIVGHVRSGGYDVVHVHHEIRMFGGRLTALLFPRLLRRLRATGARVVVTVHAVLPREAIDADFTRRFGVPFAPPALVAHGLAALYRAILRHSDAVIVHSQHQADTYVRSYGADPGRLHVVPFVDRFVCRHGETVDAGRHQAIVEGPPYVIAFGYLARRKGLEDAILGLAQAGVPDLRLVLAGGSLGDAAYAQELKDLARRAGVADRVVFTGEVTDPEANALMAGATACVVASRYGLPSSSLELSMWHGTPVVAPDEGYARERVRDGETGLLYPLGDALALGERIRRLAGSPALRQEMRARIAKESAGDRDLLRVGRLSRAVYAGQSL